MSPEGPPKDARVTFPGRMATISMQTKEHALERPSQGEHDVHTRVPLMKSAAGGWGSRRMMSSFRTRLSRLASHRSELDLGVAGGLPRRIRALVVATRGSDSHDRQVDPTLMPPR
jgi:hypothetical protein